MSVIDHPQERAWAEGEASTVALMGTINLAVAELVATIGMLIDTGGTRSCVGRRHVQSTMLEASAR